MIDYLAIGHVTEDQWPEGPSPGGTVTYASRAARAFVPNVTVLTAAAANLDTLAAFPHITVERLTAPTTTQFRNLYTPAGRVQIVSPCPLTLRPEHVTTEMRHSAIVHLAPVCNEISADIVDCFQYGTFVGVTPQGWMRRWDSRGYVDSHAQNWEHSMRVLTRADATVTSIEDIAGNWDIANDWAHQTSLLVVTQGALGCTVFINAGSESIHVPAPLVTEVEPTGAGDIFAAVLFIALQRGDTPVQACELANCIAAQSVTRVRMDGIPTARDLALCEPHPLQ